MTQVYRAGGRHGRHPRSAASHLVLLALAAVLAACSPELDWRQLRPDGWALVVSFPCRPDRQVRRVPLAGTPVEMTLLSCRAGGHTFAVASAELADPTLVEPAMRAFAAATLANVQGTAEAERPATVPGMTPNPSAKLWRISGRLPDGAALREQVLVFGHGLRVFQASVGGPDAGGDLARPFFESIEVLR